MKFTTKELIQKILESELSEEGKTEILSNLMTSNKITDGFYLKKDENGELECWFRNEDEFGTTDHGPTNYTAEQVVNIILRSKGTHK